MCITQHFARRSTSGCSASPTLLALPPARASRLQRGPQNQIGCGCRLGDDLPYPLDLRQGRRRRALGTCRTCRGRCETTSPPSCAYWLAGKTPPRVQGGAFFGLANSAKILLRFTVSGTEQRLKLAFHDGVGGRDAFLAAANGALSKKSWVVRHPPPVP